MPFLSIINNYNMTATGKSGQQGEADDGFLDPLDIAVVGLIAESIGTLATASAATLYNAASSLPATFAYLHFVGNQDCYLQIIGSATSLVVKVLAGAPFVLSVGSVLGAASTTAITGGAEPAVTAVAKVVVGNYSGETLTYSFAVID